MVSNQPKPLSCAPAAASGAAPASAVRPWSLNELQGRFMGISYGDGRFDCADFSAMVLDEVFGQKLELPPHNQRPGGAAGRRALIGRLSRKLAERLDAPCVGALCLMQAPFALGDVYHIGVAFEELGQWWILHNFREMGGVHLHRVSDLDLMGIKVEGFYACV